MPATYMLLALLNTVTIKEINLVTTTDVLLVILNTVLLGIAVGALILVSRIDKRAKDDAERLYQALPPVWQTVVLKLIEVADKVVEVGKEVTDGEPNQE